MSDSQNDRVNLAEKLQQFTEHWSPRIVGELNGQHVKLAKLEGEFVWHHHEQEDELFLVLHSHLSIHLRDRIVELDEGEFFIVPPGRRTQACHRSRDPRATPRANLNPQHWQRSE